MNIITTLILISSIRLVVETYYNDSNEIIYYFDILDIIINICFIIGGLTKTSRNQNITQF